MRSCTQADVLSWDWNTASSSWMDVAQQDTRLVSLHVQIRSTRSKVNHHDMRMPAADPLPRVCSPAHNAQILPWAAAARRRHHSEASTHA